MKNKFDPMRARLRATFAGKDFGGAVRVGEIDEENEVLHGVQITLEGEALGHGIWLDREFCEQVAEAGNATGDVGLKVRYGHPAMCSDAIGTELGRAKNFSVVDIERDIDGETVKCAGVIADVHLLKSAHSAPQGDIAKHVLETAKEDPGQFGQSIVFTYADWVVKDADGNRHSYKEEVKEPFDKWLEENPDCSDREMAAKYSELVASWRDQSADGKTYAVLGKLHGTDFTDTPAATDGIFSTGTLAEEAEMMLAEHPQIVEVLEKNPKALHEFLERTGLSERFESARVAGLQAAKDKELFEMSNRYKADLAARKESYDAEVAALSERIAEFESQVQAFAAEKESILSDLAEKTAALDSAKADIEQLTAKVSDAEAALAESQAALEREQTRYREQVGIALRQPVEPERHGADLIRSTFSK